MTISSQSRNVWKRFCAWYGADVIERKYGAQAPDDWRNAIDDIPRTRLDSVMAGVRTNHPVWPPSLFEFEQIAKRSQIVHVGPTVQEQLCEFVLRSKPLTAAQIRMPWTWLGTGNQRTGEGFAITGVVIPADGDVPGYRVMAIDMEAG